MEQGEKGLTLTVKKAMDVLDCLGESGSPLSASEIGRKLGMSRSTVYRLLATLTTGGYVTRDGVRAEEYRLGFKILELASRLLDSVELRQQARPFLCKLRDLANEAVHLVVMDHGQRPNPDTPAPDAPIIMHIYLDRSIVEVFINGCALTARIFPPPDARGLQLFAEDEKVTVESVDIYEMQTMWR